MILIILPHIKGFDKMNEEMTKIVIKQCQECSNPIQILCNETADIVSVRCPHCYAWWSDRNEKKARQVGLKIIP